MKRTAFLYVAMIASAGALSACGAEMQSGMNNEATLAANDVSMSDGLILATQIDDAYFATTPEENDNACRAIFQRLHADRATLQATNEWKQVEPD